jgi:hypothetical protein
VLFVVYSAVRLPMSIATEPLLAASTGCLWHRLVAVQALRDYGVHQSSKEKAPKRGRKWLAVSVKRSGGGQYAKHRSAADAELTSNLRRANTGST